MKLKRDNWTKEEVIRIIEGNYIMTGDKLCDNSGAYGKQHNDDIATMIDAVKSSEALIWTNIDLVNFINSKGNTDGFQFLVYQINSSFMVDESDYGALSMDIYTGHIYDVGKILPQR